MTVVHTGVFNAKGQIKHEEIYYEAIGEPIKTYNRKVFEGRIHARNLRGQSVNIVFEDSDDEKTFSKRQTVHLNEGLNDFFICTNATFIRYTVQVDGGLPVDVEVSIR